MKKLLFTLLLFIPLLVMGQTKERRVYYLDCTYTMKKPNCIWDDVRENLKNAINNVEDEQTELVVVPFWNRDDNLTAYSQLATDEGKADLCKVIETLECPTKSWTLLSIPLEDFYTKRVNSDRITYMFFMTDGENEDNEEIKKFGKVRFYDFLSDWTRRYGEKNVYGFYVMLCDMAKVEKVENIIKEQKHLWKVETADININILRLETTKASFNIRDENYVEIPIQGKTSGVKIEAEMTQNDYYHTTRTEINDNNLRIYIEPNNGYNQSNLPDNVAATITLKMTEQPDQFTFFVTERVSVNCINKKEYTLKVSVRP